MLDNCLMHYSWKQELEEEFRSDYMQKLSHFLSEEYASQTIYPPKEEIFAAFSATAFADIKVVIIGQDPYHNEGQANGFCFSVPKGVRPPVSLQNVFREISADLKIKMSNNGCLFPWVEQGVFLLNTILTVRKNAPKSHHNQGWELFTDAVVEKLSLSNSSLVFLLWGKQAQKKCARVDTKKHLCLKASHPSFYSAYKGFFGCRHFSKTNQFLEKKGKKSIDWHL